jgi:hypothetical protein
MLLQSYEKSDHVPSASPISEVRCLAQVLVSVVKC